MRQILCGFVCCLLKRQKDLSFQACQEERKGRQKRNLSREKSPTRNLRFRPTKQTVTKTPKSTKRTFPG